VTRQLRRRRTARLYEAFAAGLRARFGKLPSEGIPRILRPRKKLGTVRGFSVVDTGGNWLRVSRLGDTEEEANAERSTGLARVIDNAARLGDAKGDHEVARGILDKGLARFADEHGAVRVRALLYKAELAVRMHDGAGAVASLADAEAIVLTHAEREALAPDLEHVRSIVER
jgi:hypothetical protein